MTTHHLWCKIALGIKQLVLKQLIVCMVNDVLQCAGLPPSYILSGFVPPHLHKGDSSVQKLLVCILGSEADS